MNLKQDPDRVESGIFLINRMESKSCSKGIFSLVIVLRCRINDIVYRSRFSTGGSHSFLSG